MIKKLLAAVIALGIALAPNAYALPASLTWTAIGWSGGGAYPYVYPDPSVSGKVWLVSDVAGIWKSTNSGDAWTWSTTGLRNVGGTTIVQAPSDATVFYHASGRNSFGGAIHSSTDSGATWTNHGQGTQFRVAIEGHKALAVKRDDANTAYLGNTTGDIYRTTNRTSWSSWKTAAQVGIGEINAAVVDLTNTYLWVGSVSGLRRITLADGTVATHTLTGTNATKNRDIVAVTIAGTNYIFVASGNRLAYTTNNGGAWSYTGTTGQSSSYHISRFAIQPGASLGATKIMVQTMNVNNDPFSGGTRYKSSNGGSTWADAVGSVAWDSTNSPTRTWKQDWAYSLSLAADPNVADRFYATDFWGVFRTDNFGTNWSEKVAGAGNTVITDIDIAPNGDILVASMDNGLMKSTNGTSFTQLIPNTTAGQNYPEVAGHVWAVEAVGTAAEWNAGTGRIVATNWPWNSTAKNQILKSSNNGSTWSIITGAGIPNLGLYSGIWGDGYARSIDYSAGKLLVGLDGYNGNTNGGLFESSNEGTSWTRKTANPQPTTNGGNDWKIFRGVARNPTDSNNIIYGTFNGSGIFYSTNGGTSFASATSGNQYYVYDVEFSSTGVAYAVGDAAGPALFRSTNKGATWTQIWHGLPTSGPADGLAIDPTNPNRLVVSITSYEAAAPNAIFMTENAQATTPTFTDITGDLPVGQGAAAAAFRTTEGSAGYLYVGRYAGAVFKLNLASAVVGALTNTNVEPASLVAGAVGNVDITFTNQQVWPLNGKLVVTLPTTPGAGFVFDSGSSTAASCQSGCDGTLSVSIVGNTATLTRAAGTATAASSLNVVRLTNVKMPDVAGTTSTYSLRTTDNAGTTLDSGTAVADAILAPAGDQVIAMTGTFYFKGKMQVERA